MRESARSMEAHAIDRAYSTSKGWKDVQHFPPEFTDRHQAGTELSKALDRFAPEGPVVVGLTRGGVPVAEPVARALDAPLDMLIVRKIGAPFQPELGVGALAEGDVHVIDTVACHRLGIPAEAIPELVRAHARELDDRVTLLRRQHPRTGLAGRVVILVDDGLATGSTAHAAIRSAKRAGARRVVFATPVGSAEAVRRMRDVADEVVCLATPEHFTAVSQHYERFDQVDDMHMLRLLGDGSVSEVRIPAVGTVLSGLLTVPSGSRILVVFAHGSGSSRNSPRNRAVARVLNGLGLATLLLDLLTEEEARERAQVFDVELLADRLEGVLAWSRQAARTQHLAIGLFGASTGAAAALAVAARCPDVVGCVVSRGGRPDLAGPWLSLVEAPTLLIVGGNDVDVLRLNREALTRLRCTTALEVVPGATHLFEEPGALHQVARLAAGWFSRLTASQAA